MMHLGYGRAPGACGELVQGQLENGHNFLVSLPIDLWSKAIVKIIADSTSKEIHVFPRHKIKTQQALRIALNYLGYSQFMVDAQIISDIPEGKGLASSTADISAVCLALGDALDLEISPTFISNVARQIEPSDGTMFPDLVVYNHLNCELIEVLGQLPVFNVLIIDFGGEVDTLQYNQAQKLYTVKEKAEFQSALIQIKESIRTQDLFLLGQAAIQSGRINQRFLPKPRLEEIIDSVIKHGAYGVCVAHSGTVAGVIYDPAVSISGLEQSLQENISGPLEFIETRTLQYKFQKSKIKENFNAF